MTHNFLTNKYCRWYYNIIQHRLLNPSTGYIERHHILPKSLGGSNDRSNLVSLTAREHYLCHLLLVKMTEGKSHTSMLRAFNAFKMSSRKNPRQLTSRQYQLIRTATATLPNAMSGRKHSPDTLAKMSAARKGQPSPMKGKKFSNEAKANIAAGCASPERRAKISQALKGRVSPTKGMTFEYRPQPTIQCPHCERIVSKNNLAKHIRSRH